MNNQATEREPLAVTLDRTAQAARTCATPGRNLEQEEAAWLAKFQRRNFDEHHPALLWEKDRHGTRRTASYLPQMVKFGGHCYPTQPERWMAE